MQSPAMLARLQLSPLLGQSERYVNGMVIRRTDEATYTVRTSHQKPGLPLHVYEVSKIVRSEPAIILGVFTSAMETLDAIDNDGDNL